MRRLGKHQFIIFLLVVYFTFIGGSFYSDLNLPLRVFNQTIVTGLLALWLVGKFRRGEPLPRTPLDAPIAAWLMAHLITALLGLSPRFSLEKAWMTLVHALGFYLLIDLRRSGRTRMGTRALYMSATVVCLVGLAEFASWYFGLPLLSEFNQGWPAIAGLGNPFPPTMYRLNFTLTGATPLSAYLALLIPPAVAILLTAPQRDDRQAIAIWLALAAIVQGISLSRGGILSLLVSLPLTGLGWWLSRESKEDLLKRLRRNRRSIIAAALAGLLLLSILIIPTLLKRSPVGGKSVSFRFTLWEVAWRTFVDHPLTGVGPYNFGRGLLWRNDPALPRKQIMTAHNAYLNTAAEMGLIGLAAGAWLLLSAGRAWLARWRRASQPAERLRVAATGAALCGIAVHSLVDTFSATPNVLPVLAIAAFALTDDKASDTGISVVNKRRERSATPILALLAVIAYAAGLAWFDAAQFRFQRSVNLANQRELEEAASAARSARRIDPALTLYTRQQAYLQGRIAEDASESREAVELYRAALSAEPVYGKQTANLAAVLWQADEVQAAIEILERTVATDPDPIYLVNLGYLHQQVGNLDRAVQVYGHALARSPHLAGSDFWLAEETRADRWPAILEQAEGTLEGAQSVGGWRLRVALAQADWSRVGTQASALLENGQENCFTLSALGRARFEAGELEEAEQLAQRTLEIDRGCSSAYLVRGLVYRAWEEPTMAERDWRTALFLGHDQAAYYLGRLYEERGEVEQAAQFYRRAISPHAIHIDVEITLYDRRATFDLLPPLFRIGVSPRDARSWLALAQLYEAQGNDEQARQIYEALLDEDPYLEVAQEHLEPPIEN